MTSDEQGAMPEGEYRIWTVHSEGTSLVFDDGSVWDIPISESTKVAAWCATNRIRVELKNAQTYLTNLNTNGPDTVLATHRPLSLDDVRDLPE